REPELFATGAARLRNTLLRTQSIGEAGARIEFATTVKARAAGRVALRVELFDDTGKRVAARQADVALTSQNQRVGPEVIGTLQVARPKLWWPHTLGMPYLYTYRAEVFVDGRLSDAVTGSVGIRTVRAELDNGQRRFFINGEPLFVNGAAWSGDMLHYEPAAKKRRKL
ncbi:MAG: hypothetical protein AAFO79_12755, partial [Pseudomonadota bacterium]